MNSFVTYFLGAVPCVQLYGLRNIRGELEELEWLLDTALEHRLVRGFTGETRAMLSSIAETFSEFDGDEYAGDDPVKLAIIERAGFIRDEAFDLFERIAAARGCVFMLHPDLPGEAFLMTRAWARRGGFIDV